MAKIDAEIYSTKDYVLVKVPRKVSQKETESKGISSLRGSLRSAFKNVSSVDLQHKLASLLIK